MLAATCLLVWQDSTARILVKTYPVPEVAFVCYFIHAALVGLVIAGRNPRLAISRRPLLQMARSSFLLAATLFVMLALRFMPLVDVSAIVWVAPVLVTALSGILLHERVTPAAWTGAVIGLIGVWVITGPTRMVISFSALLPLLAALSNALYQIATRLLNTADPALTTLFYSALAGTLFCGALLPFAAIVPDACASELMLLLGLTGVASHFCLIRAFTAAPANIVAPFGYVSRLWAALFSLLIFAEPPSWNTVKGAGMIAASGMFIYIRGQKTI
jgi:drug/metabolite transporter (DMT)-like permease